MSINKAFAVSIEANRKKQEMQREQFYEAERFSNRYPKRNAIMKTLWDINLALDNIKA